MKLDLPIETWRAVHALMLDAPAPARLSFSVIRDFEAALRAAQEPPAEVEKVED